MNPSRLLFIRSSDTYGGVEKQIIGFSEWFNPNLITPVICSFSDEGGMKNPLIAAAASKGIETAVICASKAFDIKGVKNLTEIISDMRIDILCPQDYRSRVFALSASIRAKIPIVTTVHGYTGHTAKVKIYESIDRLFVLGLMKRILCVSDALKHRIVRWGVPPKKIFVVHNGIDIDEAEVGVRVSSSYMRACCVGRLSREKGQKYLIQAWKSVANDFPEAVLYIVGDGPDMGYLRQLSSKLGLDNSVRFTGYIIDPCKYMSECAIFVMPSLAEGLPVALLEACLHKQAVAACDVGGVGEIIESNLNGILVPPRDSRALSEAIVHLMKNHEVADRMALAAREKVANCFSFKENVRRIESVYYPYLKARESENIVATGELKDE